jgi:pimeloyl-ACP methyl ester carboxylesterase
LNQSLQIDGIAVHMEGPEDAPVLVMVHGWPDTCELWDAQVAALKDRHRCVRFTLPGFDPALPRRPVGLQAMVDFIAQVVNTVSPGQPVDLLLHDWGSVFGAQYAMTHPERVARVVTVDVGDAGSREHQAALSGRAKFGILYYQLWLALAWLVGGHLSTALGDRMTRYMARMVRARSLPQHISAQMNFPYFITWFGAHGSYKARKRPDFKCPVLFIYGARKPFMFHSQAWAERLAARPGCRVLGLPTGHWVMKDAAEAFNQAVREWLTPPPPAQA